MRRARLITTVLLSSSLLLVGCGGGDDSSDDEPQAAAQEVAGSEPVASTWPMTGLPVEGDDDAAQTHPVLVTKMDNTYASSPQIGLGSADLVVEELVEGGLTRLAAFFYSELPDNVGPGPVDAGQRHRDRLAGRRDGRHQRRRRPDHRPDQRRRHPVLQRGRRRHLARQLAQRAVQPLREPRRDRRGRRDRRDPSRRLPPVGRREGPAAGPAREDDRGLVRRRPHHELDVRRQGLRQREHLRRRGRRVPGRHRAGAAGQGRRRRLPRPGRQPGAGDQADRQGRGDDLPRRPAGARHLEEGRPGRAARASRPRPAT